MCISGASMSMPSPAMSLMRFIDVISILPSWVCMRMSPAAAISFMPSFSANRLAPCAARINSLRPLDSCVSPPHCISILFDAPRTRLSWLASTIPAGALAAMMGEPPVAPADAAGRDIAAAVPRLQFGDQLRHLRAVGIIAGVRRRERRQLFRHALQHFHQADQFFAAQLRARSVRIAGCAEQDALRAAQCHGLVAPQLRTFATRRPLALESGCGQEAKVEFACTVRAC